MIPTAPPKPTEPTHLRVTLRKPHVEQVRFIDSPAKRKVIRAGRRGGKTVGVATLAIKAFLAGRRVLYATPTEEQVGTFWFEVKRALAAPLEAFAFRKNETYHTIELAKTKQRIRAKTAYNADTLRGDYCDLLILDEFQLMNEDAWEVVGAPMLMDNDGDAVFVYTPPSFRSSARSKATDKRYASKLFKKAAASTDGRWQAFHFPSHANPYISATALAEISSDMTRLSYRQEIEAEDIDEIPGALWKHAQIDDNRVGAAPELVRIVIAVDPSGSDSATAAEAGIVLGGKDAAGHYYCLEDATLRATPFGWATVSVQTYHRWKADRFIAEKNYGGLMVVQTIASVDKSVPVHLINARRGKIVRAEPIAALAEKGLVHHVGNFSALEDELCSYTGATGQKSPNRLDAYVYMLIELSTRAPGRIREG